ncbi:hypothetical protein [Evansella tamaricis]|uniref:DUF4367 domain-containing protein n=1 Tax=Evansella tamaricis TaxID=2069301 RepID=A0ABS6JMN3_9BACI|nr:hypothetical protein [Evansella tamaricis]MBU9714927.1 hypothetical protein [Evansella tamaricis]
MMKRAIILVVFSAIFFSLLACSGGESDAAERDVFEETVMGLRDSLRFYNRMEIPAELPPEVYYRSEISLTSNTPKEGAFLDIRFSQLLHSNIPSSDGDVPGGVGFYFTNHEPDTKKIMKEPFDVKDDIEFYLVENPSNLSFSPEVIQWKNWDKYYQVEDLQFYIDDLLKVPLEHTDRLKLLTIAKSFTSRELDPMPHELIGLMLPAHVPLKNKDLVINTQMHVEEEADPYDLYHYMRFVYSERKTEPHEKRVLLFVNFEGLREPELEFEEIEVRDGLLVRYYLEAEQQSSFWEVGNTFYKLEVAGVDDFEKDDMIALIADMKVIESLDE